MNSTRISSTKPLEILIATGGAQGAIRRHGHGVQLAVVADQQVGAQASVVQTLDLDNLVPSGGHNDWGIGRGRESDAGNPEV